ncbi:MAG: DUF134 domain-containing protein [Desulfofustis sp.]|jgi:predicted DNA-binding protein (UPF0251 family)
MVRPKKRRLVSAYPTINAFVPQGINITGETALTVDEFEAIRLSDFEQLDQQGGAALMGVSRHTFGRLLARGRAVVADAMVTGKVLKIEGGSYELRGPGHGKQRQKRRHGSGGGFGRQQK